MRSAFGIRHYNPIGKAEGKHKTDPARLATGALFPGAHGAIAGRRGRKLRAAGHEVGGSMVGSVVPGPGTLVGGAVGTHYADKKGYYKPIKKDQGLSAFGVEHTGIVKGIRPDKTIDAAIAAGRKAKVIKPKPVRTPLADARFGPRIQKSAFGIVHKGPLAAVDDVALAPGKVKAVTGTVRPGVAVPAPASSPRKPLAQKLNAAVAATGGSQT